MLPQSASCCAQVLLIIKYIQQLLPYLMRIQAATWQCTLNGLQQQVEAQVLSMHAPCEHAFSWNPVIAGLASFWATKPSLQLKRLEKAVQQL